ncbi:putative ubiquitin-conjugating enzyme e2 23 [Quercus suber]|uniref:Ubiquitin-conjugating enzyme e2 23 n=1 Tax=Quercus suber TaxID=58331 RepID=A0AAW0KEF2_QUESU
MQEWKILENNLPETIYVRVYDQRMDLLRAVIVGAAGTPYHDGLFFFDFSANFILQACKAYMEGRAIVGYYRDYGSHSSSTIEDSAEFKAQMVKLYPDLKTALTSVITTWALITNDMKIAAVVFYKDFLWGIGLSTMICLAIRLLRFYEPGFIANVLDAASKWFLGH